MMATTHLPSEGSLAFMLSILLTCLKVADAVSIPYLDHCSHCQAGLHVLSLSIALLQSVHYLDAREICLKPRSPIFKTVRQISHPLELCQSS